MSLIDDLATARDTKPNLAEWLISRNPEEREAFETALGDPTVSSWTLVQIVRKHGGATTERTVAAMREQHVAR